MMGFPQPRPRVVDRVDYKRKREREALALRKQIRTRDKDRCRCCSTYVTWHSPIPEKRAHVHHLVFRSASKALQDAPSNLITLCGYCHALVHAHEIEIIGEDATKLLTFTRVKPPSNDAA